MATGTAPAIKSLGGTGKNGGQLEIRKHVWLGHGVTECRRLAAWSNQIFFPNRRVQADGNTPLKEVPVPTQSLARHRNNTQITPERFHADMVKLAHQSPSDAAEVANTWRDRFLNAAEATQNAAKAAIDVGTSIVVGFTMGCVDGALNARKQHMIDAWNNGGREEAIAAYEEAGETIPGDDPSALMPWDVKRAYGGRMDPTGFMGVPYTLLGTLLIGVLAIFRVGANLGIDFLFKSGATGGGAYWAGSTGYNFVFDRRLKALSAANGGE